MSILRIAGVRKSFTRHLFDGQRIEVLRGADLDLEAGSCTLVTGPSGCGKSSLLRCIYRSCLVDEGSIVLQAGSESIDIARADERAVLALRRKTIGLATQLLSVVPRVSARELVQGEGLSAVAATELLLDLGLPLEMLGVPPATFSGGQRQMLNLALVLARARPLLLLDEVTASLDPRRKRAALAALARRKAGGTTMLLVSHEMPEFPDLVDRVVRVEEGVVVAA